MELKINLLKLQLKDRQQGFDLLTENAIWVYLYYRTDVLKRDLESPSELQSQVTRYI